MTKHARGQLEIGSPEGQYLIQKYEHTQLKQIEGSPVIETPSHMKHHNIVGNDLLEAPYHASKLQGICS
jgi:hypothetical protein